MKEEERAKQSLSVPALLCSLKLRISGVTSPLMYIHQTFTEEIHTDELLNIDWESWDIHVCSLQWDEPICQHNSMICNTDLGSEKIVKLIKVARLNQFEDRVDLNPTTQSDEISKEKERGREKERERVHGDLWNSILSNSCAIFIHRNSTSLFGVS